MYVQPHTCTRAPCRRGHKAHGNLLCAPDPAAMLPRRRPSAALAEEIEVAGWAATLSVWWRAPPTRIDRESTTNIKCIACERTNIAQLLRGCAMDFSCHADHKVMRYARRRARFEECDEHT